MSVAGMSTSAVAIRPVASLSAPRRTAAAAAHLRAARAVVGGSPLRGAVSLRRSASGGSNSRSAALRVRADATDDAIEAAAASTAGVVPAAPAPSIIVPKLPRSTVDTKVEGDEGLLYNLSFGTVGLSVGLSLLIYGFFGYFNFLPGGSISALLLIYGFPISLIGFALKYAELKPLECVTYTVRGTQEIGGGHK